MGDVVGLPTHERPELLVGPFQHYKVVLEGREIPGLSGFPDGDGIALVVDGRFSATFPKELAHQAAWLIAQATAVAKGYSHLGAMAKSMPFAPQLTQLGGPPEA